MSPAQLRVVRLRRVVAIACLGLIGASWRLWLPPGEFPQIPWWSPLCEVPGGVDSGLLLLLAGGVVAASIGPASVRITRWSLGLTAAASAGLMLLDQHRLQPWAYHLGLCAVILSAAPNATGLRCCRVLVISLYLWSGWSKVDPEFLDRHGQMLLEGVLRSLGQSAAVWSDFQRRWAAALMPVGELLIGAALAWPRTRRWGLGGSIAMHLWLLAALGPWGLGHEPAVLLWNTAFLVQNWLLFARRWEDAASASLPPAARPGGDRLAIGVTAAAAVLPIFNLAGWFDHWPSWSVYSSRPESVQVFVRAEAVARLPESLQRRVAPPWPLTEWRRVGLDQWSFEVLGVPPYPQGRWRLAIAAAMAEQAGLREDQLQVELQRRTRWWGREWETIRLDGRDAVARELESYRVNTRPRR